MWSHPSFSATVVRLLTKGGQRDDFAVWALPWPGGPGEPSASRPIYRRWASRSPAPPSVDRWGQRELGQPMQFFSICPRATALALSHGLNPHGDKMGAKPASSHWPRHQTTHPLPLQPRGHPPLAGRACASYTELLPVSATNIPDPTLWGLTLSLAFWTS